MKVKLELQYNLDFITAELHNKGHTITVTRNSYDYMCPVCGSSADQTVLQTTTDNYVGWCPCGIVYVCDRTEKDGFKLLRAVYSFCTQERKTNNNGD